MDHVFDPLDDGTWQPRDFARGPFEGLQGGALSALMCAAAEAELPDGMSVVAISTYFLRPCPLEPLEVSVRRSHGGSRLNLLQVELAAGGKTRASATVTAMRPVSIEGLPTPLAEEHRPWDGELRQRPTVHGNPWLMERMEARLDGGGVPWFRFDTPVTGGESAVAGALCAADWLPGLTRADSWEQPIVAAAPNVDLSVRILRQPVGSWTGVRASGQWSATGVGVAQGHLLDVAGPFGTVACTVALVPMPVP